MMATIRKKPGRPRKRTDVCPVEHLGIIPEPIDPQNCVEMIYSQPQLFKCIVSIFKEYDSYDVNIEFYKDRVVFVGCDHSRCVVIYVVINAEDMNSYFFAPPTMDSIFEKMREKPHASSSDDEDEEEEPEEELEEEPEEEDGSDEDDDEGAQAAPSATLTKGTRAAGATASAASAASAAPSSSTSVSEPYSLAYASGPAHKIVIKRDNLEVLSALIEKTHYKMAFSLRRDDLSSLNVVLSNCEYENEGRVEVSVVPFTGQSAIDFELPNLEEYPLEFTLDSHHLRRKIGELKKISPDMIIKKNCASSGTTAPELEIAFGSISRVVYTDTYKNASKIKLRSLLPEDKPFVATLNVGRIRPLMAVNMPGAITFFANQSDPLVIQAGLDQRPDGHYAITARLLINVTH